MPQASFPFEHNVLLQGAWTNEAKAEQVLLDSSAVKVLEKVNLAIPGFPPLSVALKVLVYIELSVMIPTVLAHTALKKY